MKWRDIKETGGLYEISSCGCVRRKKGVVAFGSNRRKVGGNILSPKTKSNGYLEVSLNFNGKGHSRYVHRLVADSWLGGIPKNMAVNHKDGNKANNNVSNLEVVTYSENSKHAYDNNLMTNPSFKGESHPKAKTTEHVVKKMRELYDNGVPSRDVAVMFDMNLSTARKIMQRQTWRHII